MPWKAILASKIPGVAIITLLGAAFLAGTRVQGETPHVATAGLGLPGITSEEARELRQDMRELQKSLSELNTRLSRLEGAK